MTSARIGHGVAPDQVVDALLKTVDTKAKVA